MEGTECLFTKFLNVAHTAALPICPVGSEHNAFGYMDRKEIAERRFITEITE